MNNSERGRVELGDLVEYCLDPRYPALKKTSNSDNLKKLLDIKIGVVVGAPDQDGYMKIQPTPALEKKETLIEIEVHTEFCRILT